MALCASAALVLWGHCRGTIGIGSKQQGPLPCALRWDRPREVLCRGAGSYTTGRSALQPGVAPGHAGGLLALPVGHDLPREPQPPAASAGVPDTLLVAAVAGGPALLGRGRTGAGQVGRRDQLVVQVVDAALAVAVA